MNGEKFNCSFTPGVVHDFVLSLILSLLKSLLVAFKKTEIYHAYNVMQWRYVRLTATCISNAVPVRRGPRASRGAPAALAGVPLG